MFESGILGEKAPLIIPKKRGLAAINYSSLHFTKNDKYLTAVMIFTTLGCAIELYLPGVFTQQVASEMKITKEQEGVLEIILYVSMTVAALSLAPILKRFQRRHMILLSLYAIVIATIFAAAVPNYWTLVLSRCITGISIGMTYVVINVFFAEEISSYSNYNATSFFLLMVFAVGAGSSAILGYLLLGSLGWRALVVCASVPFFIPPIIILHICLKDEKMTKTLEESVQSSESDKEAIILIGNEEVIEVDNFKLRLFKGSLVNFINFLQGWGSILLTPALLRYHNEVDDKEDPVVKGSQLLILALLFGGVKLIGRIVGYFLLRYIPFRILQPIISVVIAGAYLAILLWNCYLVVVIGIGIANMAFCVTRIELTLMETDKYFFGTKNLATAASVSMAFGYLGACLGAVLAAFLSVHYAVTVTFALSCVQIVVFLFIYER